MLNSNSQLFFLKTQKYIYNIWLVRKLLNYYTFVAKSLLFYFNILKETFNEIFFIIKLKKSLWTNKFKSKFISDNYAK